MRRLIVAVALGVGLGWLAVGTAGHSPATCSLRGALPDRHCTPGVRRHEAAAAVCRLRPVPGRVPPVLARLVYESYGIRHSDRARYRIDELIPRELGGRMASHNLWPEPVDGPPPASAKRALDARLRSLVCAGRLSLRVAQNRVADNWIAAYQGLRHKPTPPAMPWRCPAWHPRQVGVTQVVHAFGEPHADLLAFPRRREVALSFDDGPTIRYTPVVLRDLERARAHATFFVIGREARAEPGLLRAEAGAGEEVANHTYDHRALIVPQTLGFALTIAGVEREIARTAAAIEAAGLPAPQLFRPPYGLGLHDLALARLAAAQGERLVGWDVGTDHYLHGASGVGVRDTLERARPGTIILLHDGRRHRERDLEVLPRLLQGLRAECYRVVTVSTLLRDSA